MTLKPEEMAELLAYIPPPEVQFCVRIYPADGVVIVQLVHRQTEAGLWTTIDQWGGTQTLADIDAQAELLVEQAKQATCPSQSGHGSRQGRLSWRSPINRFSGNEGRDSMNIAIYQGDVKSVLASLPDASVNCCITSPPYFGLRDYGVEGQIGLEASPEEYVAAIIEVFREVRRVLREDGTLWLNLGDSYAGGGPHHGDKNPGKSGTNRGAATGVDRPPIKGVKPKDLIGIPWMVAFALRADGWYLRSDIIWAKPNPMPESVTDRPTRSHEYVFLLTKSRKYHYDADAIRELSAYPDNDRKARAGDLHETARIILRNGIRPDKQRGHRRRHNGFNDRWDAMTKAEQRAMGRNKRSVWTIAPQPFPEAHFATFPEALVEPCVLAGCPADGTVLDPFGGSGTTALVAAKHGRNAISIELNPKYVAMQERRINNEFGLYASIEVVTSETAMRAAR